MQSLLVFLALAAPAHADQRDFLICLQGKMDTAMDACVALKRHVCTPECKSALERAKATMDGSCCDSLGASENVREQCVHQVQGQIVPMVQNKIDTVCGSGFDAAFVLESLSEFPPFANKKASPAPETFDQLGMGIVAFFGAVVGGVVSAGVLLVSLRRHGGEVAPYAAM